MVSLEGKSAFQGGNSAKNEMKTVEGFQGGYVYQPKTGLYISKK
jgi:hypothetical protein